MNNRNSMAAVIYSTELYHHGVEGMSWGERNGPPYPLGGLDKKVARAEAKRKKARERALEKARKAAKKKRKAEAHDQKIAAKQARQQEKDQILKEKLLRKGDLKDIQKNRRLFTTQELNDAIVRARVLEEISKDTKRSKKDTTPKEPKKQIDVNEVLRKLAIGAQSIGTISAAALNTAKLVDQIIATKRATKLHELDVESKELDLLTKALNAKKGGADPNANYFRAGAKFKDPAASRGSGNNQNANSVAKPAGNVGVSTSNPDPSLKVTSAKSRKLIPDDEIQAFYEPGKTYNDRNAKISRKRFFGMLGERTATTPAFWDSVVNTPVHTYDKLFDNQNQPQFIRGTGDKRTVQGNMYLITGHHAVNPNHDMDRVVSQRTAFDPSRFDMDSFMTSIHDRKIVF